MVPIMTILSDLEIIEAIEREEICIDPLNKRNIGPCSVDLTLSNKFVVFNPGETVDTKNPATLRRVIQHIDVQNQPLVLNPGQFVLGSTVERISLIKGIAATLEGRNSVARTGIIIHAAGLVQAGTGLEFPSTLTLEIFCLNSSPVKIYPGDRIIQIIFHRLGRAASEGYDEKPSSQFIGQTDSWWSRPTERKLDDFF